MTKARRQALADRLLAEHIYKTDFVRGTIGLLAVLPILYGILTWTVGMDLWAGSEVYRTALTVPGAPQSWGSLFLVLGGLQMFCAFKRHYRLTQWVALAAALMIGMFMVTFGAEYWFRSNESALPPALGWGVFSVMYLNIARYGAKMSRLDAEYGDLAEDPSADETGP
jgi:hypothetical protein